MGQVTIYLEDEIEKKMIANAKAANLSKSKWIATVIKEKVDQDWPPMVRELPGSWAEFPTQEELRESKQARDCTREEL